MVEHTLRTVHESLVQGYCATADCATGDCVRLRDKRYYCTTGKEKNTTSYARNTVYLSPSHPIIPPPLLSSAHSFVLTDHSSLVLPITTR